MIKVGDKAPEFTLVGTDLKPIKLADYSGKNLILHFFPLAFTSVCTAQMCTARDEENWGPILIDILVALSMYYLKMIFWVYQSLPKDQHLS